MNYTYQDYGLEMIPIKDAIKFDRILNSAPGDSDYRYMAGYIDAVAATMASQDPFLEDAGDIRLMNQLLHDRRLDKSNLADRKHAYLSYIREAAAAQEAQDAKV